MPTEVPTVLILAPWSDDIPAEVIDIEIDRHSIVKRRWRKLASNGKEIAFQLNQAAKHHDLLAGADGHCYKLAQSPESVIEIPMPNDQAMATKLGWYLGNQHLGIEVREKSILLEDIHTLRRSLDKIGIPYQQKTDVFLCSLHSSHSH